MRKILNFACFALISTILVSCSSASDSLVNPDLQTISALSKDDDKDHLFTDNDVAKSKTQKFLTNSPDSDEHPIWSHNGKYIAFQRLEAGGGYNVWLMKADGTEQHKLTNCEFDCQQPTWSADEKFIAYRKAMGKPNEQGRREFDIAMIELKTGKEQPVITYIGDDKHPNFSRDGKYMVFNSERDGNKANLYIVPTSNTKIKPVRITKSTDTNDVHPNFSDDGKKVLYHSYILNAPPSADPEDVPSKLGIVNSDGTGQKWIPTGDLLYPKHPFFTPESDIITFHATDPKTLKRNVYATNIKKMNGKYVQITDIKNAKHPEISPDGKYLAYSHKRSLSANTDKQYDISVVQIDLKELKKLL